MDSGKVVRRHGRKQKNSLFIVKESMNEFERMRKLAGLLTEAQDKKITLDVKVGDKDGRF